MSDDQRKKIEALEHTISVLHQENSQLAERAEDSLLLGLISESLRDAVDEIDITLSTLERVAILKSLPYAACLKNIDSDAEKIAVYSTFAHDENLGFPITLSSSIIKDLNNGPLVTHHGSGVQTTFNQNNFNPALTVLIPFTCQAFNNGVFLFLDESDDIDRLASMLGLLSRVVEMAMDKCDNLYLLRALAETNKNLEFAIQERTKDLKSANLKLKMEVSTRKASQQALLDSHNTVTTVLDSIDSMIYVADFDDERLLFMNKWLIDELGNDYTGEICHDVIEDTAERPEKGYREILLDEHNAFLGPLVRQRKEDSSGKFYIVTDRAIHWTDGRLARLHIATDITLIKQMESSLQHSQKMESIGTLAGGIAHDFNNLLMGIQGRASLIATEVDGNSPLLKHVSSIEEYVRNGASLTSQLLGFARGGKYQVKIADINTLVANSCSMFARTKKELTIRNSLSAKPLMVEIDKNQIEQVLVNIFFNSWQAMPGGGEIIVETGIAALSDRDLQSASFHSGNYCFISVTDTGIGMDETTMQRIFDPFFTTKKKERGIGLGLAAAYGIVRNHGGYISVSSELGSGSTFKVHLPLTEVEPLRAEQSPNDGVKKARSILFIDDEKMIRDVAIQMLKKLGYRAKIAKDGFEALEIISNAANDFDLIILDLIMPGMNGSQTFDEIRKILPRIPVLLSSGYSINGQAATVLAKGCQGFLQKPFNLNELREGVDKILDATELKDDNSI